jgi:hypothetical protein
MLKRVWDESDDENEEKTEEAQASLWVYNKKDR